MQAHDDALALQQREHPGLHHEPSAAGNYGALSRVPTLDKRSLQHAKCRFPILRKDLRDRFFLLPFDLVIAVHHVKAQLVGHGPAHGALARAHKSNDVEIDVRCIHRVRSHETHRPAHCQTPKSL